MRFLWGTGDFNRPAGFFVGAMFALILAVSHELNGSATTMPLNLRVISLFVHVLLPSSKLKSN